MSSQKPLEQYNAMRNLLNRYDESFLKNKPTIIVGTKIDKQNAYTNMLEFKEEINLPVIPVSAVKKINLRKLMTILRDCYEQNLEN